MCVPMIYLLLSQAVRHMFVSQRAKSRELAAAKAQLEENRRFEKEVGESLGSTAKNAAEKTSASKKSPKAADTGKKPNAVIFRWQNNPFYMMKLYKILNPNFLQWLTNGILL